MAFRYVKSEYLNESLPADKGARSLKFEINISKKVNREHKESREEEMEDIRNRKVEEEEEEEDDDDDDDDVDEEGYSGTKGTRRKNELMNVKHEQIHDSTILFTFNTRSRETIVLFFVSYRFNVYSSSRSSLYTHTYIYLFMYI